MPRISYSNICATICVLVTLGAVTASASGAFGPAGATKTITGCYAKKGSKKGLLRIASKCKRSETKLSWNQRGPAGPVGATGPAGAGGTTAAFEAALPAGAVMYFDATSCPAGWSPWEAARGRYLVGLPAGGLPGAPVGTALTDREDRPTGQHTHAVNDPGHSHGVTYDTEQLANQGNTIGGTRRSGGTDSASTTTASATTGITIAPSGDVPGTNAPYVQLLVCRKD